MVLGGDAPHVRQDAISCTRPFQFCVWAVPQNSGGSAKNDRDNSHQVLQGEHSRGAALCCAAETCGTGAAECRGDLMVQSDVRTETPPVLQGEPSDSAALRGARASSARALVFLAHAQRPVKVRQRHAWEQAAKKQPLR